MKKRKVLNSNTGARVAIGAAMDAALFGATRDQFG